LGGRVVYGDAARELLLLLFGIVGGQVRRDPLPAVPSIARAEEELVANVNDVLIRRADLNRGIPIEAELLLVAGLWLDVVPGAPLAVHSAQKSTLRFGVPRSRIGRVHHRPEAVAAVEILPSGIRNAARERGIANPRAVVLQASVDLVRILVVGVHVVELRHRKVLGFPPSVSSVVRE